MKNFYFVLTLNVSHPLVKDYLEATGLGIAGTVDIKTRSKLFNSFEEAIESTQDDFDVKLDYIIMDDEEHEMSFGP